MAGPSSGTSSRNDDVALRQLQHPRDQVDARHGLGHRVLDLQAGVDLEERRLAAVDVVHVLDGARGPVGHRRGERPGGLVQHRADLVGKRGRRGLLDHLLVAPLQRAVAVAQAHHAAGAVAEHLHLQVPRAGHEPLQEHPGAAEARRREALHAVERGHQLVGVGTRLHADPPATADGLDHDGVADDGRRRERLVDRPQQPAAGDQRDARRLAPPRAPGACRRTPTGARASARRTRCPAASTSRGELRVLRQEPVPGVDRAGAGLRRRVQHELGPQVALARGRGAEAHRDVGEPHVRGCRVRVGVHRHRLEAEVARGAQDADGDLAAVGHEQGVEHGVPRMRSCVGRAAREASGAGCIHPGIRHATEAVFPAPRPRVNGALRLLAPQRARGSARTPADQHVRTFERPGRPIVRTPAAGSTQRPRSRASWTTECADVAVGAVRGGRVSPRGPCGSSTGSRAP